MSWKQGKKPEILIVDDQPLNLQLLSRVLSEEFDLRVARSGQKALEIAFGEDIPDLILLDINMPDIDGYEVCKLLKGDVRTQSIAIIFITARTSVEDEEKGFLLGAADYITKPFSPVVVRARVRNHINLKIRTDILESVAHTDSLTAVSNRRSYDEYLPDMWNHCMRSGSSLSVLMMDIDHFKAYNDTYGHGSGDECLRQVAQTIDRSVKRSLEFFGRYGGEEFVAVLPDVDCESAMILAEQLRAEVQSLAIEHSASSVAPVVTISIGCASTIPTAAYLPASLTEAADSALYVAKKEGRNTVRLASNVQNLSKA